MKKLALTVSALLISAGLASAFEWGGKFSNTTAFSGKPSDSLKLNQTDNLDMWLKVPLSKDNATYITAEAFYQFKYDGAETSPNDITNTIDLSLLKFVTTKQFAQKRMLSFSAGRFALSDATYLIFSQVCDGAMVKYTSNMLDASVYGGYTGLVNANSITMINSESTNFSLAENNVYRLSPKYIPVGASVSFPSLFANQTLSAQAWAFFDLNGDNFNRYYGIALLEGYLLKNLSYSFSSAAESVNFQNFSLLSKLNLTGYFTDSFSVNFAGIYASGDEGGLTPFTGVTSMNSTLSAKEPQYSSLLKFGPGATKTFGRVAYINGTGSFVFDVGKTDSAFDGIQLQVNGVYNIFNDLQVGATFGQYFDLNKGHETGTNNKTYIALKAVLVF